MNHEQYVIDGYYPRGLRGSGLPESEDDFAVDESEFRPRPEPRKRPMNSEQWNAIVRHHAQCKQICLGPEASPTEDDWKRFRDARKVYRKLDGYYPVKEERENESRHQSAT